MTTDERRAGAELDDVAAHHGVLGKVTLTLRDRPEKIAVSRSYAHRFRQM